MPVAFASARVWQATQPALVKIGLPAAGIAFQLEGRGLGLDGRLWQGADDGLRGRVDDALRAAAGEERTSGDRDEDESAHGA